MKRVSVFSFILSLMYSSLVAQPAEPCGTMQYLQQQLQENPLLQQSMDAIEQHTQQYTANPTGGSRAVITIPVVVHVVYNTTAQNISDQQIQSQITRLNLDFRKLNSDWTNTPSIYQNLVADFEIEFCLAVRDPNGNPTTGITRTQTSVTSFTTNNDVKYTATGGRDAWPRNSYLNIWVCNLGNNLLGYAQFPGGAAATDGVVVKYNAFGTTGTLTNNYRLGRTTTHEIGHWLNLRHIWGDATCGNDQVSDTPLHEDANYGCQTYPHIGSCGSHAEMTMNYMDYSYDQCSYMFTAGQKTRARALFATGGNRVALLNSQGCVPVTIPPTANFTANTTSTCTGVVQFTDQTSGGATSWLWNFGDGTTSTQQNPIHNYTTNGTYTVTLTSTNSFGSDVESKTNYITVNRPTAPTVSGGSRCGAGTVSLSANVGSDGVKWYASATDTTPVSTANPFTPNVSSTTTYYAERVTEGATSSVGPATNTTLGAGSYFSNSTDRYLIFNVLQPCTLVSVRVYAQNAGTRVIALRNSAGTTLQSATVALVTGLNTVTLNFPLSVGNNFQLGINGTANLYRNNAVSGGYPFSNGLISITGSDAGATLYYYFYNWQVKAADCASIRTPATATVNSAPEVTVAATNGSCTGGTSAINLIISGGTPNFSFLWNDGNTAQNRTGIATGTYTVTVTDASSCSVSSSATIAQTGSAPLSVSGTANNISCNGANNGTINISVNGGTPGYSFNWGNGITTQNRTELSAGSYTVTIVDANSCSATYSAIITQPTAITASITPTAATCGASNGSATVSVSGGNPTYTYLWSNGANTALATNLSGGNYTVTITDASGCSVTSSAVVTNSPSVTATVSKTNVTCFGAANGSATVNVTSGTSPYSYLWSNGVSSSSSVNNLSAGSYSVTVIDAKGCSTTSAVSITQPNDIHVTTSVTDATVGMSNGTATVTGATGGTPPYHYEWQNGSGTGLAAGTYFYTLTDANNCTKTGSVTINETPTGVKNISGEILFSVYPNPASSEVTITVDNVNTKTILNMKNVLGQTLLTKELALTATTIDLSSFASGVYIIELNRTGIRSAKRLVISK